MNQEELEPPAYRLRSAAFLIAGRPAARAWAFVQSERPAQLRGLAAEQLLSR